jgi:transporter family protein
MNTQEATMFYVFLILTILFWGIAPVFDKAAVNTGDPLLGTVLRGITVGVLMLAALLASGRAKELLAMPGRTVLFFVISGIFAGALGAFTYFKALQLAPASKVVPLASTYPLVAAVLSVLLLGESITVPRLVGIILIIAGVLLVK